MRTAALVLTSFVFCSALHAKDILWKEHKQTAPLLAKVPDFAALAKKVLPSVVAIQAVQKRMPKKPQAFDFFFSPFENPPEGFERKGIGSGLVIHIDGLVLTNYHVVENAMQLDVIASTENETEIKMSAKVLGVAPRYDVALLQLKNKVSIPAAVLGNSDKVNIGDWVMAIGNPFGLSHSVSVGIISAKERRNVMPSGRSGVYDFLQTDAAINPGNSGGPLINMRGEVVGINAAINEAGSGIGFAIPINMIKQMLPDLKEKGRFDKSWLGIRLQPLSDVLAESFGLKHTRGALVADVVDHSPAHKAGIRAEDIIVRFDGKDISHAHDLPLYASMAGVGSTVQVALLRKGKQITTEVTLAPFPQREKVQVVSTQPDKQGIGMVVADITPDLKSQFGLSKSSGVVIKHVDPDSVAAKAGLYAGDVVLNHNGQPASTARTVAEAIQHLPTGFVVRIKLLREGRAFFLAFKKP